MLPSCSRVIEELGRAGAEVSVVHTVEANVPRRTAITK